MDTTNRLERCAYPLLFIAAAGWLAWLFFRDPVRYVLMIAEDQVGENFTALAALAAGGYFLIAAVRPGPRNRRIVAALLALGSVFIALEEVSFGQRLLGYQPPDAIRAINRQGEMNLHNVVDLFQWYGVLGAAMLAWLALSLIPVRWRERGWDRFGLPAPDALSWPWALLAALLCLGVVPAIKSAEMAELAIGVMLMLMAVRAAWRRPATRTAATAAALAASIVGAMVMVKFYTPWLGGAYVGAAHAYELRDMDEQAIELYEHIAAHPVLRTSDAALGHARLLQEHGRADEAQQVLGAELAAIEQEMHTEPLDRIRRRAGIHLLLDEPERAAAVYDELHEQAAAALAKPIEPDAAAEVYWTLARGALDRGSRDEALASADQAFAAAGTPRMQNKVRLWVRWHIDSTWDASAQAVAVDDVQAP